MQTPERTRPPRQAAPGSAQASGNSDHDYTECPTTCKEAALFWFRFGLQVIPIRPDSKRTRPSWRSWLDGLSERRIESHWTGHPEDEVGAIVDNSLMVLDADNEAQRRHLLEIETALDVQPNLIVTTSKGEHHWFRRAPGTFAQQAAFSTEREPAAIDVKTGRTETEGRSMVVLPPSRGKDVALFEADTVAELAEVDQSFIDAVFRHNGRQAPRERETKPPAISAPPKSAGQIVEILSHVDPDCGYDDWLTVGMALHDKFSASDEGLAVYSNWSAKAHDPAPAEEIEYKWRSFTAGNGITFASVAKMAADAGADLSEIASRYDQDGRPKPTFVELKEQAQEIDPDGDVDALIADAAHLPPVRKRKIHELIKRKTGLPFSVIQQQEAANSGGEDSPDHLDVARQLVKEIGPDNVLCTQTFVFRWNGEGLWEKQHDRAVKQWVQTHLVGKVDAVAKANVDSVTDLFRTEIFRTEHEFDTGPPECVNLLNGELTLEAGQWVLKPHRREHYRTTQLPLSYDPDATAPRFVKFLAEVFAGDPDAEEKATAILELMGYSLMAHARHEKFVILVGIGANGKSVLLYVLEHLLGTRNVSGVQPSQFDNKFQRAHLHGKLANLVTELRQGAVIDDDALKGITSGETTTVEHKHKDPFDMRPFATCWFGTNHMPHTRDFSDALFRRALVVEFSNTFKPEQGNCDANLKERLAADELPGILNLSLSAYANATANGFTIPPSCEAAREHWRLEADQVAQFVDEACTRTPGAEETTQDLFKAYGWWASEAGIQNKLGRKSFTDRLVRLGCERARQAGTGRYVLRGIQLLPESRLVDLPTGGRRHWNG